MSLIANTGVGEGLLEIAGGFLGLGLISMIVFNADKVNSIVKQGAGSFHDLLSLVINPAQNSRGR